MLSPEALALKAAAEAVRRATQRFAPLPNDAEDHEAQHEQDALPLPNIQPRP